MTKDETNAFAQFPWMLSPFGAFSNMAAPNVQPANALATFQRAWAEAMTASVRGFQSAGAHERQSIQSAVRGSGGEPGKAIAQSFEQFPAVAACQEALKNAQTLSATVLNANMKAFDTLYGRFAAVWGEIGRLPLERNASGAALPLDSAAKAYEGAARESWKTFEKAQETSAKAWTMLQKRLTEGVHEMNAAGPALTPAADMPAAMKESYDRLAADSAGLFDVVHKTNTNALSLMQKRFSAAVDEMASHFPAAPEKGIQKLEAAAHAYERAASTISDALLGANREAMEAVQSWTIDSMKSGARGGQKAA